MSRKTSKIWLISNKDLQLLLNRSSSKVEVLQHIGLSPHSGNHRTLTKRLKEDEFDLTKLHKNQKQKYSILGKKRKLPYSKIFKSNSNVNRNIVKNRIIKDNLIIYECHNCKNNGSWLNKPLSLQLEHINGISNDNRLENLRFLCPNCHSQTETYAGKKLKKPKKICPDCKTKNILNASTKCVACTAKNKGNITRKFNLTKKEIQKLLVQHNMYQISKMYNVSFTTVKKYCKRYGCIT